MTDHNPLRPGWTCRGCGRPWPCETSRQQLLAQYLDAQDGTTPIRIYMALQLADAVGELPHATGAAFHHRFVAWTTGARPARHAEHLDFTSRRERT